MSPLRFLVCGGAGDGKSTLLGRLAKSGKQGIEPAHERYTADVVAAASTADAAPLLADAQKGTLIQTRSDAHLVALLGVRNIGIVVNRMDLVDYAEQAFRDV